MAHLLDEASAQLATAPRVIHEASADSLTTDREIDALVYEVYGLTDEEIAVVEGNLSTDAQ